jgi:hypothetical protein
MGVVRPVMVALVLANVRQCIRQLAADLGCLGARRRWAFADPRGQQSARVVMAGVLAAVIVFRERRLVRDTTPKLYDRRHAHPIAWRTHGWHTDLAPMRRRLRSVFRQPPVR